MSEKAAMQIEAKDTPMSRSFLIAVVLPGKKVASKDSCLRKISINAWMSPRIGIFSPIKRDATGYHA